MKKLFYAGAIGLILFEVSNVYFIMPMPGSQRMNSLDVAYFLYSYRWLFRIAFGGMILAGISGTFKKSKYKFIPIVVLLATLGVVYTFNFEMAADSMFRQPEEVLFKPKGENILNDSSVVIAVANNGETKAYPIRFIGYHHQVQDVVGGKPMIITYCTVCRTGRVFEPVVKGQPEKFLLVGMDHFNAMFEDERTGSWWRQVNGEAIAGKLKGEMLPEVESFQTSVGKLFELYPNALVMQLDKASKDQYDSLAKYEKGKSKGALTKRDSLSWKDKSWVVGVVDGSKAKAYDWNELLEKRVINDKIGETPIALVLAEDNQTFAAFVRLSQTEQIYLSHDTIKSGENTYRFSGQSINSAGSLKKLKSYQEFWHSWQTFHANTERYN